MIKVYTYLLALILNLIWFWPGLEDFLIRAAVEHQLLVFSSVFEMIHLFLEESLSSLRCEIYGWSEVSRRAWGGILQEMVSWVGRLTGGILSPGDLEELLDVGDFARHVCDLDVGIVEKCCEWV